MRLRKFDVSKEEYKLNKKNNRNRNISIRTIILSLFILVGSIMLFTYSKFSKTIKLDIMHAKVAKFMSVLTYDANGGTVDPTSKKLRYDDVYGELPTPYNEGYDFDGWWTDETDGEEVSELTVMGQEDTTIYAHWVQGTYTLTYDNQSGEGCTSTSVLRGEQWGTLCEPTRSGYTFMGWYTGTNGTGEKIESSTVSTGNLVAYAKWNEGYLLRMGCNAGYDPYGNKLSCIFTMNSDSFDTYTSKQGTHYNYVTPGTRVDVWSYYGTSTRWYFNNGTSSTSYCSSKANIYFIMPDYNLGINIGDGYGGRDRTISYSTIDNSGQAISRITTNLTSGCY